MNTRDLPMSCYVFDDMTKQCNVLLTYEEKLSTGMYRRNVKHQKKENHFGIENCNLEEKKFLLTLGRTREFVPEPWFVTLPVSVTSSKMMTAILDFLKKNY